MGLLLALVLVGPAFVRLGAARRLSLGVNDATGETRMLGYVRAGAFQPLAPREVLAAEARFTALAMQAAQAPESGELDLSRYEGQAVILQGRAGGGWVYGARVVSTFAPWPTLLIRWAWLGR